MTSIYCYSYARRGYSYDSCFWRMGIDLVSEGLINGILLNF